MRLYRVKRRLSYWYKPMMKIGATTPYGTVSRRSVVVMFMGIDPEALIGPLNEGPDRIIDCVPCTPPQQWRYSLNDGACRNIDGHSSRSRR